MNNNILVTGGLGFIGSHFIHQILAKGYINADNDTLVINVDFMGYGSNINNLKDVVTAASNKRYRYIHANINSKEALDAIAQIADIDIIVNFAAETHVDRSISYPTAFVES